MNQPSNKLAVVPDKITWLRGLGIVGAIGVLALSAGALFMAVQAALSLLALGLIAAVGLGLTLALPMLCQKWENKLLALRKAEARKNPIEEMQNFFMLKKQRVEVFKQSLININTQIKNMQGMLDERKVKKPNGNYTGQENAIKAMEGAYTKLSTVHENAKIALGQMEEMIEEKKWQWGFAESGKAALAALNDSSAEDIMKNLLADEACAAVVNNFNSVFAQLEVEAMSLTDKKELTFEEGMTIDLSSINMRELNKVPA